MSLAIRRALAGLATVALAVGSLAGCSQDNKADKKDGSSDRKTAAILEYGAADTLKSLGLEDHIVASCTSGNKLPKPLEALDSKLGDDDGKIKDLGSLKEPKLDLIAQINPDFIYYGARGQKLSGEFEKLSDNVRYTQAEAKDGKSFFESNRENVLAVAKDFGVEDKAKEKLDEIDKLVADTKAKAEKAGTALVLLTTGGKISAFGPENPRYGFVYKELGFKPAGEISNEDRHGATLSWEEVAEMNPDHVFVFDRDAAIGKEGQSAEEILNNEIFKRTTAAKKNQVHYLQPQAWYLVGGGLDSLKSQVTEVADAIK